MLREKIDRRWLATFTGISGSFVAFIRRSAQRIVTFKHLLMSSKYRGEIMTASRFLPLALGLALAVSAAAYASDGASKPTHYRHSLGSHLAVRIWDERLQGFSQELVI